MIYLLYGENDYLVSQKKKNLEISFKKKFPDVQIYKFYFPEDSFEEFVEKAKSLGIFSQRKIFFLESLGDYFSNQNKKVHWNVLENIVDLYSRDPKNGLIFIERKEKSQIIKFLLTKEIKSFCFKPFSFKKDKRNLENFIRNLLNPLSKKIEEEGIESVIEFFGEDGWKIENELKKAAVYSKGNLIKKEDIEKISHYSFLSNEIFLLSESILRQNKSLAIFLLKKLLDLGEKEDLIFNILLRQIRNFVRIKYFSRKDLSYNPYYVKKVKSLISNLSQEKILRLYKLLAYKDFLVKTSQLSYKEALFDFFRQL